MTRSRDQRRDQMKTESREALAAMLQLDLEARGDHWDERPGLSFLYEDEDGWHISAIGVPDHFWDPSPATFLDFMSKTIGPIFSQTKGLLELTRKIRPATWRGVAFFSESWMVEQKVDRESGEEPDPVFTAMAEARMLHQHPAREEARCWWAALDDGTAVSVAMRRVSGQVDAGIWAPGANDKEKPDFVGKIPQSLSRLVTVLAQS